MKRALPLAAAVAALALPAAAAAGPSLDGASKERARVGDFVVLRASAGLRFAPPLPLYLVPAARAPEPSPCGRALCAPKVAHEPRRPPFARIGTIDFRRSLHDRAAFRVPHLPPGPYVYVLYCAACYRGPAGSLIAFTSGPTLTVTR